MTREEIPYRHGFAGECVMCKIAIGAQDPRVAVYEAAEGKKREYIGILCPTCAKIARKEEEPVVKAETPGVGIVSDIELLLRIYDLGMKYSEKHKIKVQPEDVAKMSTTVFIESRR